MYFSFDIRIIINVWQNLVCASNCYDHHMITIDSLKKISFLLSDNFTAVTSLYMAITSLIITIIIKRNILMFSREKYLSEIFAYFHTFCFAMAPLLQNRWKISQRIMGRAAVWKCIVDREEELHAHEVLAIMSRKGKKWLEEYYKKNLKNVVNIYVMWCCVRSDPVFEYKGILCKNKTKKKHACLY